MSAGNVGIPSQSPINSGDIQRKGRSTGAFTCRMSQSPINSGDIQSLVNLAEKTHSVTESQSPINSGDIPSGSQKEPRRAASQKSQSPINSGDIPSSRETTVIDMPVISVSIPY